MIDILFCDNDLLILNKPPGLLCVPGLSTPENLLDLARKSYPNIRVVHRLDMATSGIIIFALNHASQKHLGKQFELRKIKKHYRALVEGLVEENSGEISAPLICDWENRPRQKLDWHNGKTAHTLFSVVERHQNHTELLLYPITGRSHQLRVHCQWLGHPIVGDNLYHPSPNAARMMLHAEFICFQHPTSQQQVSFRCPAQFHSDNSR